MPSREARDAPAGRPHSADVAVGTSGTARRSDFVYGCSGAPSTRAVGPRSTIRPSCSTSWTTSVSELALVLSYVDSHDAQPPPSIAIPTLERVADAVCETLPSIEVHLGLGGIHVGVLEPRFRPFSPRDTAS